MFVVLHLQNTANSSYVKTYLARKAIVILITRRPLTWRKSALQLHWWDKSLEFSWLTNYFIITFFKQEFQIFSLSTFLNVMICVLRKFNKMWWRCSLVGNTHEKRENSKRWDEKVKNSLYLDGHFKLKFYIDSALKNELSSSPPVAAQMFFE